LRIRLGTLLITLVALLFSATAALAAPRDVSKLLFFEDGSPAGGQSSLIRDGEAGTISAHIKATHLNRGHAYTYWWVVFNDRTACNGPDDQDPNDGSLPAVCGENDVFIFEEVAPGEWVNTGMPNAAQIAAAGIGVLGGNGQVANNGGRATFTGTLFEESAAGHEVVIGPEGLGLVPVAGSLLESGNAMTAEIHIVVRDHGPALSGAALAAQLNTFTANCIGLDPDGTYVCEDQQFAVHKG
jgi:hypothetical protein